MPKWQVMAVKRVDAGNLYNAVRYDTDTNGFIEADTTPTHDEATAQRIADKLNAAAESKSPATRALASIGQRKEVTRPSLRAAVEWIALNDNAADDGAANPDAERNVAGYVSTLLVADLFGVTAERVAFAVMRVRAKATP